MARLYLRRADPASAAAALKPFAWIVEEGEVPDTIEAKGVMAQISAVPRP